MESSRLLTCLADDYARLREVAARDLSAAVPSCPGWNVTDLVRHVAVVYLHKVEAMRRQEWPDPWPPDLSGEEPIALLERAYAELTSEFDRRKPADPAWTWYEPDQTVGFWIRRMAQETVIHRIDAELALREAVAPIPDDLAVDGVDEILVAFVDYATHRWRDEFQTALKDATGQTLRVAVDGRSWLVTVGPEVVTVATPSGDPALAAATISGAAEPVLRWLWARAGDDAVRVDGDASAVTELRQVLATATL